MRLRYSLPFGMELKEEGGVWRGCDGACPFREHLDDSILICRSLRRSTPDRRTRFSNLIVTLSSSKRSVVSIHLRLTLRAMPKLLSTGSIVVLSEAGQMMRQLAEVISEKNWIALYNVSFPISLASYTVFKHSRSPESVGQHLRRARPPHSCQKFCCHIHGFNQVFAAVTKHRSDRDH
jgi:hypothetical protein